MWALFLKCMLGAGVVLIISILSKSKAFYIAGLVPLFPTFALIAHVIVFQQKEPKRYKNGSVWSMVTYSLCHLFSCGLHAGNTRVDVVVSGLGNLMLGGRCGRFNLWLAVVPKLNERLTI